MRYDASVGLRRTASRYAPAASARPPIASRATPRLKWRLGVRRARLHGRLELARAAPQRRLCQATSCRGCCGPRQSPPCARWRRGRRSRRRPHRPSSREPRRAGSAVARRWGRPSRRPRTPATRPSVSPCLNRAEPFSSNGAAALPLAAPGPTGADTRKARNISVDMAASLSQTRRSRHPWRRRPHLQRRAAAAASPCRAARNAATAVSSVTF